MSPGKFFVYRFVFGSSLHWAANRVISVLANAMLLLALTLASCSKENDAGQYVGPTSGETCKVNITLETGLKGQIETKNSWHENTAINNVWVIQLSEDGKKQLCKPKYVTTTQAMGGTRRRLEAFLVKDRSMVIFLANTGNSTLVPETGNTLASIQMLNYAYSSGVNKGGAVPSYAVWTGQVNDGTLIERTLRRTSARITLSIDTRNVPEKFNVRLTGIYLIQWPQKIFYLFPDSKKPFPTDAETAFGTVQNLTSSVNSDITNTLFSRYLDLPPNVRGKGSAKSPQEKTSRTCPDGEAQRCGICRLEFTFAAKSGSFTATERLDIYLGRNTTDDFNIYPGDQLQLVLDVRGFRKSDLRITESGVNTKYLDLPLRWSRVNGTSRKIWASNDTELIAAYVYHDVHLSTRNDILDHALAIGNKTMLNAGPLCYAYTAPVNNQYLLTEYQPSDAEMNAVQGDAYTDTTRRTLAEHLEKVRQSFPAGKALSVYCSRMRITETDPSTGKYMMYTLDRERPMWTATKATAGQWYTGGTAGPKNYPQCTQSWWGEQKLQAVLGDWGGTNSFECIVDLAKLAE